MILHKLQMHQIWVFRLCESSPNSKIAHDLKELAKNLGKVEFEGGKRNLFSRFRTLLGAAA